MWKWQCAFTRWTPSNQYLDKHGKSGTGEYTEKNKKITLSRFGFIGWDEKCYWGLFGVMWVKPLPIWQQLDSLTKTYGSLQGKGYTPKYKEGNPGGATGVQLKASKK